MIRPFALAPIGLLFLATGCLGNLNNLFDDNTLIHADLQATDHDRTFPGVRASYALLETERERQVGLYEVITASTDEPAAENPPQPEPRRARGAVRSSLAIDAEYTVGLGGDDRRAILGTIEYDEIDVAGGPAIELDYDLHLATLGARGGIRVYDYVALEGLGGLSISALRLQLRNATQSVRDTGVSMGAHLGSRITVSPHPVFDLFVEGKLHMMGGLQGSRRFVFLPEAMAAANLHLTRHASIFGGYRWWRYRENIESASDIDDLGIEGPTFGILGRF